MDSSAPSTTATRSADYRWVPFYSRSRLVAEFRAIFEEIPLSLLCFWFGPLIYAASLGTVAVMLLLATCTLIVSRCGGLLLRLEEVDPAHVCGGAATLHARNPWVLPWFLSCRCCAGLGSPS
jgi:hypothetical protein